MKNHCSDNQTQETMFFFGKKNGPLSFLTPSEGGPLPFNFSPTLAKGKPTAKKPSSHSLKEMSMPIHAFGTVRCRAARGRVSQREGIQMSTNLFTELRTQGKLDWRMPCVMSWYKVCPKAEAYFVFCGCPINQISVPAFQYSQR